MSKFKTLSEEARHFGFLLRSQHCDPRRAWAHIWQNIIRFDLRYGTETARWVDRKDYPEEQQEHLRRYRASLQGEIAKAINTGVRIYDEHGIALKDINLVDAGSGKGKVLMVASMLHHFKSVTGVEFNPALNVVTRSNLNIMAAWHEGKGRAAIAQRMRDVSIHQGDIVKFTDYGPTSLVYAYFPFDEEITAAMKARIEENTERCVLLYNYPAWEGIFTQDSTWTRVGGTDSKNPDKTTHIFAYGL